MEQSTIERALGVHIRCVGVCYKVQRKIDNNYTILIPVPFINFSLTLVHPICSTSKKVCTFLLTS